MRWIVIHEYDGGNTPYGIETETETLPELFEKVEAEMNEEDYPEEMDNPAIMGIAKKLGIDFDPFNESLTFIDASEVGEFVKI